MMENAHLTRDRWGPALVIAASLLVVAALLAVGLLVVAIQQRLVEPPRFALHFGQVYLDAPCPNPAVNCDINLNYYAVWRGQQLPDGRIHYEQVYFTYLQKKR